MKTENKKRSIILLVILAILVVLAFVQHSYYKTSPAPVADTTTTESPDISDTSTGTTYTPPAKVICKATATNKVNIYNKPSTESSVFGSFSKGQVRGITAISGNGWFAFQATGNTGVTRYRYIAPGASFNVTGNCTNLTKIATVL